MDKLEPALQNISGNQAPQAFSTHPRWSRYPAARERLKAYPIGSTPQAGTPSSKPTRPAKKAPMIDLEKHGGYLESW